MSKESFGDIAKKLTGNSSKGSSAKSEPIFKSKPLNEGTDFEPKFRSTTEYFERRGNNTDKGN
ncbi:hypothetical protein [Sutcliffiella horikoshii]|uniref:Uncharacterized protein n=1 Tax=Sutcliffiella horikoshii TaxID=79883 RepID=A0A5D4SYA5_9BACI|nr:hypothetical protein [Sutcliffiella horikoshii]TYS67278.1 hypothetical protein FZC75_19570 [Sutcliffiella horikoshii]